MRKSTRDLPGGAAGPSLDPLRGRIYLMGAYSDWQGQNWRDKLMVIQDVPAPPEAALTCPERVVWWVYLPTLLLASQ